MSPSHGFDVVCDQPPHEPVPQEPKHSMSTAVFLVAIVAMISLAGGYALFRES